MKPEEMPICNRCIVRIPPNARIMAVIESEFRHLADYKKSKSLLKKYLTEELFNTIKDRVTCFGSTLLDVILSGVENINSKVGVYAPDDQIYKVFPELFDQIIKEYHNNDEQPPTEFGFVNKIIKLDFTNNYIISIKILCNRSLYGYPFNRRLNEEQFKQLEMRVSEDLLRLEGNFKGLYTSLIDLNKKNIKTLIEEKFFCHNQVDNFMEEAIGNKCWPIGRGVFCNLAKNFFVWINIEDHLSVISLEQGADLGACYRRFVVGLKKVGKLVGFVHDKRLGYLNFCPTNLGTGMEISVQMHLYKLPKHRDIFHEIAKRYHLFIENICTNECAQNTCTVVFKPKLGMTEFETVKWMQNAILDIIRADIHLN